MKKTDTILCISDLHLSPDRPDVYEAFRIFLRNKANKAKELFILGDFFDLWIGDDDPTRFHADVSRELLLLKNSGTNVSIMHGNRDFLLGQQFANSCSVNLLPEHFVLNCYGKEFLLMHGDSLCTRDSDYMAFRIMVRDPQWQQEFLAKPLSERQTFAIEARAQSKAMSSNKAEDITDVTPTEVIRVMEEWHQTNLIHGHTHRPGIHDLASSGIAGKRIVLGDWDEKGWYLEINPAGYSLQDFSF